MEGLNTEILEEICSVEMPFGKYKGSLVTEIMDKDSGYFGWLLNADFPLYTKKVLTRIRLQKLNTKS